MFRYSLLTLLAAILLISLGFAALVNASEVWAEIVVTATVLGLLVASVGAIYLPGKSRAFAGGFAIFGWAYLLMVQGPWPGSVKPRLLTTVAMGRLETILIGEDYDQVRAPSSGPIDPFIGPGPSVELRGKQIKLQSAQTETGVAMREGSAWLARQQNSAATGSSWMPASTSSTLPFHQIGQSLWTILLACLGGVLAKWFNRGRSEFE